MLPPLSGEDCSGFFQRLRMNASPVNNLHSESEKGIMQKL